MLVLLHLRRWIMSRRNTISRIKGNRNLTVIDVSETLSVHPKTVRNWIRAGLPVVDTNRPLLINGSDLKVYLKQKRNAIRFNCGKHEMSCFRCQGAAKPSIESVLFIAQPAGMALMKGVCEECGCKMNKYVSWRDVNEIWLEPGWRFSNVRSKADYQRWHSAVSIRLTFRRFMPDAVTSGFIKPAISLFTLNAKSPRLNPVLKITRRPFLWNVLLRHCVYPPMSAPTGWPA